VPAPAGLLLHPRRALDAVAARPRLLPAAAVVAGSGVVSVGLDQMAATISPRISASAFPAPSPLFYLVVPGGLLAFWALSVWLIDAGARLMARPPRRRAMLAAAGHCFLLLAAYGLVVLLQALAVRLGAGSGGAWAVGWLDAPLLLWFLALLGVAVVSVYRVEPPGALALALLPFACLLGALLVYTVLVTLIAGPHAG
jgi:hypothetical protein